MKTNKPTLLVAMLAMVLVVGSSALAQVAEETRQTPTQARDNTTPTTTQQVPQETTPPPAQTSQPAAPPTYALSEDGQSLIINGTVEVPCADIFRDEQAELGAVGVYPTAASDEARACEDFGVANPYPAPYFYDPDGFLYVFNPVEDRYTSYDEATGLLYVYDLIAASFYIYDPASSTYV
jgi:hypothetical protein